MAHNHAAFLDGTGTTLRIGPSPMPKAGAGELVIRNHAIAINPIDGFQQATGAYLESFPVVLGHDIAGEIYEVGSGVTKFQKGDRVIAHCWGMITKQHEDAGFAEYSRVKAGVTALLPTNVSFTEGVAMPVAIGTAASALYDNLQLPLPSQNATSTGKVLLVYGGSSSVGLTTTQLASAAGIRAVAIASERNHGLCKEMGASQVLDQKDPDLVDKLVAAIGKKDDFVGIFDTISWDDTYANDYKILEKFGSSRLLITHPVPENVPAGVQAKMVFSLGGFAFPVWEQWVPKALQSGALKCRPKPLVVGRGLEKIQDGINRHAKGVSAQKVVVEL
ncbi:Dehydrogenase orsE [Pseudocercospora fuligena]|uniref:Dehydrogenase orsE n=1 Tax=Pseudocercospora fuligena TaxID=685502 RepID=A0A8H6RSC7_9PEZI|nr:Dehydrogenase orsE [Pseudocercospora fuligena]